MRTPIDLPIADLVPHGGRMRLLDRALEGDAETLLAEVTVREDSLFFVDGAVGGWVGIEYMAQAVAAWAGWHARLRGETPKVGFLLGTRRYECSRPAFQPGECLRIEVHRQFFADNGLGQFDCTITIGTETVATAALTVFEPPAGQDVVRRGNTDG
ncbi:hotdog family protein [Corallococcus sp. CA053C]|uniref:hotdog family protein n=1 Tax=Corallococcus sp. CA053C TaxID=2316732 RepID=UPI001F26E394|nr:hotdog family protein [Corallococcus sp. CA053C]